MLEEWRDIRGYEGIYQVSNFGRIKNSKNKILKPFLDSNKYLRVILSHNTNKKYYTVCKLVATVFIPNPQHKKYVAHIDGNNQNNHVDNLKWTTASNNRCVYQFDRQGNFIAKYESLKKAEQATNVNNSNIDMCANGFSQTAFNYIWIFEEDLDQLQERVKKVNERRFNERGIKINQYTLDGEFMKTYQSGSEIERLYDYDCGFIGQCCKGKYKQAYGYVWRYAT